MDGTVYGQKEPLIKFSDTASARSRSAEAQLQLEKSGNRYKEEARA